MSELIGKPSGADPAAVREPPFDPTSWSGAFVLMIVATGVLWAVELADALDRHRLDRFGLRPRTLNGLTGVVTSPFLHSSAGHLLSNSAPFLVLGWMLMLAGLRSWLIVTGLVVVVGGLLTWAVAPSGLIVGASGLTFGWLGYLLARAVFARRLIWIFAAVVLLAFFGGLLGGLLPGPGSGVSWQSHVCGFAAGVATAWVLHPRRNRPVRRRAIRPHQPPAAPPAG